ncbi:hypothetical protein AB6A40_003273 [Gnathostoma spinigerum]|uniref:Uncharacterized protein n=1 Tax=Gnathostoma spinigerum TaxID=75299 RepID=A0ABD6EGW3_9BILA
MLQATKRFHEKENKYYDKYIEDYHNWFCYYNISDNDWTAFNIEQCSKECDIGARAWKLYEEIGNHKACSDWAAIVRCHDEIPCGYLRRPAIIERLACPGFRGHPMSKAMNKPNLLAPMVSNEELEEYKGLLLHAQELVVHCPVCMVDSKLYFISGDEGRCYMKLKTLQKGWPRFVEKCNQDMAVPRSYRNNYCE